MEKRPKKDQRRTRKITKTDQDSEPIDELSFSAFDTLELDERLSLPASESIRSSVYVDDYAKYLWEAVSEDGRREEDGKDTYDET